MKYLTAVQLIILAVQVPAFAVLSDQDGQDAEPAQIDGTDLQWVISGTTITISYHNYGTGVTDIPDYVNNQPWRDSLGSLTAVVIGENVTGIGNKAFQDPGGWPTNIVAATIGEDVVTIGVEAFIHAKLTSLTIPDSVSSIGARAFSTCPLSTVELGTGLKTIGNHAFYHSDEMKRISIPDTIESIAGSAFLSGRGFCDKNGEALPVDANLKGWIYELNSDGKLQQDRQSTVSFDMMGHGQQIQPRTVPYGGLTGQLPEPAAEGFVFGGWYKDSACTKQWDAATDRVGETVTLYAKWVEKVTVKFDANGGDGTDYTQTIESGVQTPLTQNTFTKTGYTFFTWNDKADGTGEIVYEDKQTVTLTADLTLYAQWAGKQYTVTFDSNGGTAVTAKNVTYGSGASSIVVPTKSGLVFDGFYTDNTTFANELVNSAGLFVDLAGYYLDGKWAHDGNVTVYAKWIVQPVKSVTVKFDANGHGDAPKDSTVISGEKVAEPDAPSAKGYRFDGWYTESSCKTKWDFNAPVIEDMTLYAKWTKTGNNTLLIVGAAVAVIAIVALAGFFYWNSKKA